MTRWRHSNKLVEIFALSLAACVACAAIYPEIDTPIGPPPNVDVVKPPPPEDYVCLYIKGARLPSQTRDGRKWGKGNGYPSTYAIVSIDGEEVSRTEDRKSVV